MNAASLPMKVHRISFVERYNMLETTDNMPASRSGRLSLVTLEQSVSDASRRIRLETRETISRATIRIQSALDPSDGTETALEARTHIAKGIYPFVGFSLMFTVLIALPLVGVFASGPWARRYWRPLTAPVVFCCGVFGSLISG